MEDWKSRTLNAMKTLNMHAVKMRGAKGQHFLIKYRVVRDMVKHANLSSDDNVYEIGGGLGILSSAILEKVEHLTIIEKDPKIAEYLSEEFGSSVTVINKDALQYTFKSGKLLSNLPYSVGSDLLVKALHSPLEFIVVMLQKEVARRCTANPGETAYGRLSATVSTHASTKYLFEIPPTSFIPQPKVESAVISLKPHDRLESNHTDLELLYRNLFQQKNKVLRKVVRGYLKKNTPMDVIENIPYKSKRIRTIPVNEFQEILTYLKSNNRWPLTGDFHD